MVGDAGGDWRKAVAALADYDEAVAAQAAGLLRAAGVSPSDTDVRAAAKAAGRAGAARVRRLRRGVAGEPDRPAGRQALTCALTNRQECRHGNSSPRASPRPIRVSLRRIASIGTPWL